MSFITEWKINYEVTLLGKKIGEVSLTKKTGADGDKYIMLSESQAKIFFVKRTSSIHYDVLYQNGVLVKSSYDSQRDDGSTITEVLKDGDEYQVVHNGNSFKLKEDVHFSSVMLYYKEPVGISEIFVERIGKFLPLKKLSNGEYSYHQPDDTIGIFRYQNGKLLEVQLKRKIGSVFVRPV